LLKGSKAETAILPDNRRRLDAGAHFANMAAMKLSSVLLLAGLCCLSMPSPTISADTARLRLAFRQPPDSAKPWAYWWWLDSAASRAGITADFEAMQRQGIAGVLLFDAGEGGTNAPKGPLFMSEAWRELFRHALRQADRRGLEVGVNLCSGWNAGGTWVTPEHAAKKLVWSETFTKGPGEKSLTLPLPPTTTNFYREIAVLALPLRDARTNLITHLELKAGRQYAEAPSGNQLADLLATDELSGTRSEAACRLDEVQVLTERLGPEGRLTWQVPAGHWLVLRFGYTLLGSRTKCTSPGAEGNEIDFFSRDAFDHHFAHTAKPLLEEAKRIGAKSLKYFHVDSYESGNPSWSARFADEFRARRGYDLLKWMPVLTGRVVESPEAAHRFLWDIRRTIGDLYAANYYGRLAELSHQAGIGNHPESSGPFWHHIDALQCAGGNDVPMTEFWKRKEEDKEWVWYLTGQETFCDLVKQAASAAHTYGRPVCQAEAYTTMGPNWEEDPFAMKDIGDRAFCAGLTRNVLCFYVHQPDLKAFPGYEWEAAGTHFDSHITWWNLSHAWLTYLARCQHLLRQGRFVADFCYFYGEDVPNFVPARSHMSPPVPAGFDCDTINAEVLLNRLSMNQGRLTLPDGMSYRYLVLPHRNMLAMSPPVLRKIKALAEQGASVIGPAPQRAPGLSNWPQCDAEIRALARELWGENPGKAGAGKVGQGRVIWGRTPAEVVGADHLAPDVEFRDLIPGHIEPRFDGVTVPLDWIHRREGGTDIYLVANIGNRAASARLVFRAAGRPPELWDAVTGGIRALPEFTVEAGRTIVPLKFAPKQSFFVVFGHGMAAKNARGTKSFPEPRVLAEITGPWQVSFDPSWGGPENVTFEKLEDWTERAEEGIRYYSGTATYRKTFDLPPAVLRRPPSPIFLSLGRIRNLARVQLNGKDLGVIWTAPWRVEITDAAKTGANELAIEVVNLWPNRLIGDAKLPSEQRRTKTNVRKFEKPGLPLLESGLLGPVTLQVSAQEVSSRP
jgi:hypothetical protein